MPAGLSDRLPPDAAQEARVVESLLAGFASHGYERVKPPLVEFEESLLGGMGVAMSAQTFRLMDPVSQRMMAVRADTTPQIARIAITRLARAPRPLRLCYVGEVLRVRGTQLAPERQLRQAGAELFGAAGAAADAEVVLLAADALERVGVRGLSVDLNSPPLVRALLEGIEAGADETARAALTDALDHKDAARVAALAPRDGARLGAVIAAAGPARAALDTLGALDLPASVGAELAHLAAVVKRVEAAGAGFGLTIDPVENRGFEYHTGVSFTLFAAGVRGELGRGGRYLAGAAAREPATGFTLYVDAILRALPAPERRERLFLPLGTAPAEGLRLREAGWVTVAGLDDGADARAEARRLGCSHLWLDGAAVAAG